MDVSARSKIQARLPKVYAAALYLYYAVIVMLHPQPPQLGDFSRWIYFGEIMARHLSGQPDPAHFFFHYPVPNSTHAVLLGLFSTVMTWSLAGRLYLLLSFGICLASVRTLARAAGTSSLIWFIAPSGFFLAVNFWYGFLAFQLGVALLFFFTAALLQLWRLADQSKVSAWPISILLILLFFTHMVPFTFACLMVLLFVWQTGRFQMLWHMAVPAILAAWYVAGRIVTGPLVGSAITTSSPKFFDVDFWLYKVNTFGKSFGLVNPIFNDGRHSAALAFEGTPVFLLLFAGNLAVCLALLWIYARNMRAGSPLRQVRFVWLAAAIALPAYAVAPRDLLAISDPGSRILQTVAWLVLFFCLKQENATSRAARVAAGGSVLLALAGAVLFSVIPWRTYPHAARTLPAVFENLANARSEWSAQDFISLSNGYYDAMVFPTSVMGNRVIKK